MYFVHVFLPMYKYYLFSQIYKIKIIMPSYISFFTYSPTNVYLHAHARARVCV